MRVYNIFDKREIYWFGIFVDIEKWVSNCDRCVKRKIEFDRVFLVSIIII